MFPHRLIYKSGKSKVPGVVYLRPGKVVKSVYKTGRLFGAGLITFAIVGILFSFWPIVKQEFLYNFGRKQEAELSKFSEIINKPKAEELGLDPYFSIYIPKIDAKARVVANVDAGNPKSYLTALRSGVAHAAGTNFPGQGKTIYLFSHSTDSPVNIARYNAVFYLLGKLEKGDRVIIYFLGQEHDYVIADKFVTGAKDTSWLNPDSIGVKDGGKGERLVLQTCDPPGTSWNRLIVVARPIINNPINQ